MSTKIESANNVSPARKLALQVLLRVENQKSYANIQLDENLKASNLSDADKRLASQLVYGTLEKQIKLDYIISQFSNIPLNKMLSDIRCILRMAVYQLIELDKIPESAVCNEAVKLAKSRHRLAASGFVNGVLRSILRNRDSIVYPDKNKDMAEYLSVKYACPKWIVRLWQDQYGDDAKGLAQSTERNLYTALKVNTLKISVDDFISALKERGIMAEKSQLCDGAVLIRNAGDIRRLYGYDEGYFLVEDESSQLSVKVLSPEKGELMLDVCSAPGGKSFAAAIEMADDGCIKAYDIREKKLKLIRDGAKRLGLKSISVDEQDASVPVSLLFGSADRVLCDVPCSGLGIIRKKPDIKLKTYKDIENLPNIQLKILQNCSQYVKKGGVLVYSTCTLNKKENEEVVQRFLQDNTHMKLSDFSDLVPDMLKDEASKGYITLMPHKHGCDGFFIARFRKAE